MIMTLHNRRTRTETCHSATSSIINLTWAGPRRYTGLRGEKPATNRLSHSADLTRPMDSQSVRVVSRPSWGSPPDLSLKCIFSLVAPYLTAGRVGSIVSYVTVAVALHIYILTYLHIHTHLTHPELCTVQCTLYARSLSVQASYNERLRFATLQREQSHA